MKCSTTSVLLQEHVATTDIVTFLVWISEGEFFLSVNASAAYFVIENFQDGAPIPALGNQCLPTFTVKNFFMIFYIKAVMKKCFSGSRTGLKWMNFSMFQVGFSYLGRCFAHEYNVESKKVSQFLGASQIVYLGQCA